jgi:hypothetical protein
MTSAAAEEEEEEEEDAIISELLFKLLATPSRARWLPMSSANSDAKRAFSAISNITACLSASRSAPAAACSEQTPGMDQDGSGDVMLCRCVGQLRLCASEVLGFRVCV